MTPVVKNPKAFIFQCIDLIEEFHEFFIETPFFQRMEETEEKVRHLVSDPSLRGQNHPRVIQLLGLRGHLQDELIRIQTMVAEGDPKLKVRVPLAS